MAVPKGQTLAGILAGASPKPAVPWSVKAPTPKAPAIASNYGKGAGGAVMPKAKASAPAAPKPAAPKPAAPKPTAPKKTATAQSSATGKTKTAQPQTPSSLESQLGVMETLDIQGAQDVYDANAALRQFQREQANRQLQDALKAIDRASIENYKGIANDYAARGMQRSGGYMQAESSAMADTTRAKGETTQAVDDILAQLNLAGVTDLQTLNTAKQKIMADYLLRRFAPATGQG